MSSLKPLLITVTSVISLVFIWTLLTPESEPVNTLQQDNQTINRQKTSPQPNTALLNRIQSLENELVATQTVSQQLNARLTELEQQVKSYQIENSEISELCSDEVQNDSIKPTIKPATLQDKLIGANIPLDTIQRIQSRVGQNRLAQLQLRDQAIREDWMGTPEYVEQEQQLPASTEGLREEFGDQVYDQYLYASGRPNRVIVREVFSGSAANDAGIEPRDIIISYASNAIYSMGDLQQATTEGDSGETVLIELLRDDISFSTSAPRGPLGISMTFTRIEPE